jgi:hypothetical protein
VPPASDSATDSQQVALTTVRGVRSLRWTTMLLLILVLVHVGWIVWKSATNMPTIDFLTFWSVPHSLSRQPIANIYSPEAEREMGSLVLSDSQSPNASNLQRTAAARVMQLYAGRIDVTGTPFLYTAIGWLSSGKFDTDQKRFVSVCGLCLALSVLLLGSILQFSFVEMSLLFMFIATYYAPILADIQVGNVNQIELLGVVLFIFFIVRSQPLVAGLVIGMAAMLKPMPAAVVVLAVIAWLIDREYSLLLRMLAGCFIAAAACFFASTAYFHNAAIWGAFLHSLSKTLNGTSYSLQNGNFSLSASIFGANGLDSAVIAMLLSAGFGCFFFRTREQIGAATRNGRTKQSDASNRLHTAFAVAGGGCAMTLLTSPLVWPHYFVLLLPLSLYLMRPNSRMESVRHSKDKGFWSIAEPVLPFVLFAMFSFLAELVVGNNARSICILFSLATLSTLALALYGIWRRRRGFIIMEAAGAIRLQAAAERLC